MRQLSTARLTRKLLLSEATQCYHLEFSAEEPLSFEPGQFLSCVADDSHGKQQTRAYSLASAPRGREFDICVNRVEGGFLSNRLCDLREGDTIQFHGPHGFFTLHQPLTDSLFVAADTGVAPIRGFVQWLFPEDGSERSAGKQIWLLFQAVHPDALYYAEYFREIAAKHANFHFSTTLHETVENVSLEEQAASIASRLAPAAPAEVPAEGYAAYAYVCGLNAMVAAVRPQLAGLGWARKQIVFERYD